MVGGRQAQTEVLDILRAKMLGAKWDGRTVMAPEHRQRMRPSKQSRSGPRKKSSPSPSGQAMKSRPLLPSLTNTICPTTPGGRRAQRFQGNFPLYLFQQFNSIQFICQVIHMDSFLAPRDMAFICFNTDLRSLHAHLHV